MSEEHAHHEHGHGGGHSHAPPDRMTRAFVVGISLNIVFVVIGIIAGIAAHSTALLADAAHNFGDVLGLGMAFGATVLARRAVTARRTYGLRRTTRHSRCAEIESGGSNSEYSATGGLK